MSFLPNSKLGKISMWLTVIFIIILALFFVAMALNWVSFTEGAWWDLTIAFAAPIAVISLILSVISIMSKDEHSVINYFTIAVGVAVILFLLSQSMFI
ncbi:MAG: hypothetical protein A2084_02870 [Tenericutes bacterium GWC2_39_45]|nr:MAG: hypothetical protein A2084_02870 [Tenericutes bacterium GWC2_39_45]OHE32522.1 MAG: hypothetical protein A2009_05445 [Tenericutes bacterium GWD2_38_27]OHE35195.1 MAG: hypothetical protein A2013_01685 [Tenericutes bacterium GWE2_38_8]